MTDTEWRAIVAAAWDRVPPSIDTWESLSPEQRAEIVSIFAANDIALPIDWPVKVERICILCRHWQFYGGSPWYSDVTPGNDASTECVKGHWITRMRLSPDYDLMGIEVCLPHGVIVFEAQYNDSMPLYREFKCGRFNHGSWCEHVMEVAERLLREEEKAAMAQHRERFSDVMGDER